MSVFIAKKLQSWHKNALGIYFDYAGIVQHCQTKNKINMKVLAVKPQAAYLPTTPFEQLIKTVWGNDFGFGPFRDHVEARPAVNIVETEQHFRLEIAAPGLGKEDFRVELEQNRLTISAEKQSEKVEGENVRMREFAYNSFKRSFTLPKTVDGERIEAKYEQGVLSLVLPKKEEALPKPARTIEIA